MYDDPRGTITQQGYFMRIDNALVEEVSCQNRNNGYMIVSYVIPQNDGSVSIENLRLNLNRNTVVLNAYGRNICACCVQKGMWINVVFSSRLTRSIPPQSNAYFVTVQQSPQPASVISIGRIAYIDPENRFLYTGNINNINSQTRYVVTDDTVILDEFGNPAPLERLGPGELVQITHADFQTASIPPQTTAYQIQVLED